MTDVVPVTAIEVLSPDEAEARAAVAQIRSGLSNLWEGLARIVAIEGWKALGYNSFRRWAADELGYSLSLADKHLRKTRKLIALSQVLNQTIAELEPRMSLNSVTRRPKVNVNPVAEALRQSTRKLLAIPHLTNPDERNAAIELRNHLNRLLGPS